VWEYIALPWITVRVDKELMLTLYVSKAVRRGDPILDPLEKWKIGFTYTLLHEEEFEDEAMMFGKAVSRQYQLADRRANVRTP
jgi:hypothetical protein